MGGGNARVSNLRLTIQARTDAAIVVMIRIKVVSRGPLLTGTYLACYRGGGDFAVQRDARVDLDEPDPRVRYFVADQETSTSLSLTLTRQTVEMIDLYVTATRASYEWTAEADILADGKQYTLSIDYQGKPFRTSGLAPGAAIVYVAGTSGGWTPESISSSPHSSPSAAAQRSARVVYAAGQRLYLLVFDTQPQELANFLDASGKRPQVDYLTALAWSADGRFLVQCLSFDLSHV